MKILKRMAVFSLLCAFMATSCSKDDDAGGTTVVVATPIKSMNVTDPSANIEKWDFTYDANKRVSEIKNYWNGVLDKTITYDYSVAGKLKITSGTNVTNFDINSNNLVTKEYWNDAGTEYGAYDYDANGFMTKVSEFYDGSSKLKQEAVILNGSETKQTRFTDAGVASRIREFTYTPGDNVNEIFQKPMIDHNTKPIGGIFGKPNKKLLASMKFWDPRVSPIVERTTSFAYDFDAENRPIKITSTLHDGTKEIIEFTY